MEGAAVLPGHAHAPPGAKQFAHIAAVLLTPRGAVEEEHVGALRLHDPHALEMLSDIRARPIDGVAEHLGKLVHPHASLQSDPSWV